MNYFGSFPPLFFFFEKNAMYMTYLTVDVMFWDYM